MFVYTIQPVVNPVWQPVWQQVVSCKRGFKRNHGFPQAIHGRHCPDGYRKRRTSTAASNLSHSVGLWHHGLSHWSGGIRRSSCAPVCLSVCLSRTPSPKAVRFKVVVAKTLIANLLCFKQGMRNWGVKMLNILMRTLCNVMLNLRETKRSRIHQRFGVIERIPSFRLSKTEKTSTQLSLIQFKWNRSWSFLFFALLRCLTS